MCTLALLPNNTASRGSSHSDSFACNHRDPVGLAVRTCESEPALAAPFPVGPAAVAALAVAALIASQPLSLDREEIDSANRKALVVHSPDEVDHRTVPAR